MTTGQLQNTKHKYYVSDLNIDPGCPCNVYSVLLLLKAPTLSDFWNSTSYAIFHKPTNPLQLLLICINKPHAIA